MIANKTISEIVRMIVKGYDPEKIILFGSFASNTQKDNSDLDLFIIKNTDESYFNRMRKVRNMIHPYPCAIDLFVYTPDEFENNKHIQSLLPFIVNENGVVLYERNKGQMDS